MLFPPNLKLFQFVFGIDVADYPFQFATYVFQISPLIPSFVYEVAQT